MILALCAVVTPSVALPTNAAQKLAATMASQSLQQQAPSQQMPTLNSVVKQLNSIKTILQGSAGDAISAYGDATRLKSFLSSAYEQIAQFALKNPLNTSLTPGGRLDWDYISTNVKAAFLHWHDLSIDTNGLRSDLAKFCNAVSAGTLPSAL